MDYVTLGSTGIKVNKNGFGALPIQRDDMETSTLILQKAYANGINFYDTAYGYTDSEEKIGVALSHVRENIILASKTPAKTAEEFWGHLELSLSRMKTSYIDIYQFHNPAVLPKPGDGSGLYEAMLEAKAQGKIRHIGITNHRWAVAKEAVLSGLYETLQFPYNYLSGDQDKELVDLCEEKNMGFICMKALSGGLITNGKLAYAYLNQFENLLPIWGIQHEKELDEFVSYQENPPVFDEEMQELVEKDKNELAGEFCRGCGYCLPCPVGIPINMAARMSLLLRRSPQEAQLSEEWQENMRKIEDCLNCGKCKSKCPYGLDIPTLLKKNLEDYKTFLK